jgi:hypothetical protein
VGVDFDVREAVEAAQPELERFPGGHLMQHEKDVSL